MSKSTNLWLVETNYDVTNPLDEDANPAIITPLANRPLEESSSIDEISNFIEMLPSDDQEILLDHLRNQGSDIREFATGGRRDTIVPRLNPNETEPKIDVAHQQDKRKRKGESSKSEESEAALDPFAGKTHTEIVWSILTTREFSSLMLIHGQLGRSRDELLALESDIGYTFPMGISNETIPLESLNLEIPHQMYSSGLQLVTQIGRLTENRQCIIDTLSNRIRAMVHCTNLDGLINDIETIVSGIIVSALPKPIGILMPTGNRQE